MKSNGWALREVYVLHHPEYTVCRNYRIGGLYRGVESSRLAVMACRTHQKPPKRYPIYRVSNVHGPLESLQFYVSSVVSISTD